MIRLLANSFQEKIGILKEPENHGKIMTELGNWTPEAGGGEF